MSVVLLFQPKTWCLLNYIEHLVGDVDCNDFNDLFLISTFKLHTL